MLRCYIPELYGMWGEGVMQTQPGLYHAPGEFAEFQERALGCGKCQYSGCRGNCCERFQAGSVYNNGQCKCASCSNNGSWTEGWLVYDLWWAHWAPVPQRGKEAVMIPTTTGDSQAYAVSEVEQDDWYNLSVKAEPEPSGTPLAGIDPRQCKEPQHDHQMALHSPEDFFTDIDSYEFSKNRLHTNLTRKRERNSDDLETERVRTAKQRFYGFPDRQDKLAVTSHSWIKNLITNVLWAGFHETVPRTEKPVLHKRETDSILLDKVQERVTKQQTPPQEWCKEHISKQKKVLQEVQLEAAARALQQLGRVAMVE